MSSDQRTGLEYGQEDGGNDEAVADRRLIASNSTITRSTNEDLVDALDQALTEYLKGKIPKHAEPT